MVKQRIIVDVLKMKIDEICFVNTTIIADEKYDVINLECNGLSVKRLNIINCDLKSFNNYVFQKLKIEKEFVCENSILRSKCLENFINNGILKNIRVSLFK